MLSKEEIIQLIDDDKTSVLKKKAAEGQRYYEAEHDILKYRMFYFNADGKLVEDTFRSNSKICHPFFMELTEQLAAYITSSEDNPIQVKSKVDKSEELQEHLDSYFDDTFWAEVAELIIETYTKGFGYLYGYKNEEGRMVFEAADTMGVVEVREKDTDDGCRYVIYWYIDRIAKGKKTIKRIQVWSENEIVYYVQDGETGKLEEDTDAKPNPRPHAIFTDGKTGEKKGFGLGFIPFWRLDNNKKKQSGLKPIKGLIDDYDLMQCGLSNNLKDFDTPLHVVKGFDGDNFDKLQTNLKTKKIVGVDSDGDVEVKTIDIPYQARQAKAADDEKNIYRFGMGLNTQGLKDTTATTNIAIKTAYALLDMKASKLTTRLKSLLKELLKIVLDEINKEHGKQYLLSDIEFKFKPVTMTNETENIQNEKTKAETKQIAINTILNVAAQIGDEQVLKAICEEMDWDFEQLKGEVEKLKETQNLIDAKKTLEGAAIDDEGIETPVVEGAE